MKLRPRIYVLSHLTAFLLLALAGCGTDEVSPGDAWQIVELPTKADIWSLQFLDAQRGYLVGGGVFVEGGLVGRTVDGGLTWELDSGLVPKRSGVMSFAFYDLFFLDDERAFLAGHAGLLMGTVTGWKGFERVRGGPVYAHLREVQFVDQEFGWVSGETALLGTDDGGESWDWLGPDGEPPPRINARAFHFVDRQRGHLVGRHGMLQRSFDGGRHWEDPESMPVEEDGPHLFGVHFADADHGWAVGESGTIWHSNDGGAHWNAQQSGVSDFFMDVHFIDAKQGWVVGHDRSLRRAVVLGTQDGGTNWAIEVELLEEEFYAIDALPTGEAWVVGKHAGQGRQRLLRRVPPVTVDGTD